MTKSPSVDEERGVREQQAAKHAVDVKAILAAAKKGQRQSRPEWV